MKMSRWLSIEVPISLKEIGDLMKNEPYREGGGEGFILKKANRKEIKGQFIQKKIIKQVTVDPFGKETEFELVDYSMVKFSLSDQAENILEIESPPRTLRPFIDKIAKISGFGLVVSPITVEPMKWLKEIEKNIGKTKVTRLECSGVNVLNKGTAKIILNSQQDIRNGIKDLTKGRDYNVNNLTSNFIVSGNSVNLELRGSGIAKFPKTVEIGFSEIVKDALFRSI